MIRRCTALLVAVLVFATACGGSNEETVSADQAAADQAGAETDSAIPAFLDRTATTVDGQTVDLADYANQDLILWFWAPW